jgi:hypothetical protein
MNNQRLQTENELLKQEKATMKKEIEDLKTKHVNLLMRSFPRDKQKDNNNYKQYVDLTGEEDDDDDEVQIVEKSVEQKNPIIEINDDDDDDDEEADREVSKEAIALPDIGKCNQDDADDLNEASEEKRVKQFQEIDYPSFENFIMSQI